MDGSSIWSGAMKPTIDLDDRLGVESATGNLVIDAQIAGLCMQHGVETIVSEDRDFGRFPSLRLELLPSS